MCELDYDSLRGGIQRFLMNNSDYNALASEIESVEALISDFGFLSFGRDYLKFKDSVFSLQIISRSLELTISNVKLCCDGGCIADANTLLRKFRDDLFFYLYVLVCDIVISTEEKQ